MDWIAAVGAFGLGSVATTFIQGFLSIKSDQRNRNFQERKEAYVGLLESWVRQENDGFTLATELDVGHWLLRSKLVCSNSVLELLETWEDSKPGSKERIDSN